MFRSEYPRVLGTLRWYLGDNALAEDLAQETFVRLCQNWEKVSTMAAPGPWLHRVSMNLAKSKLRRAEVAKRKAHLLRDPSVQIPAEPTRETLRLALLRLSPDLRSVIVLRYYADFSVADTASALNIAQGTVKTRARKALASLQDLGLTSDMEYVDD